MNKAARPDLALVERTADMDYIIPFGDDAFTLSEETIENHYIPVNAIRNNKLGFFDITFVKFCHPAIDLDVAFGKSVRRLHLTVYPSHLSVSCDCGGQSEKLCIHAYKTLVTLLDRRGQKYFSKFYKPEQLGLAEYYPEFFQVKTTIDGVSIQVCEQLGAVYIPDEISSDPKIQGCDKYLPEPVTHDQLGYCIYTIYRQDHLPFLAGFLGQLLNDGSDIKSFSTLFQTSAAPDPIEFTDQQLMLNAIGSQIQSVNEQLSQTEVENSTSNLTALAIKYNSPVVSKRDLLRQRLLDLWSRAHKLLSDERFVIRYSDGRKITYDHKPKKGYTRPFRAADSGLSITYTLTQHQGYFLLHLNLIVDGQILDSYELFPAKDPLFVLDNSSKMHVLPSNLRDLDLITALRETGFKLTVMDIHLQQFNAQVLRWVCLHYPVHFDFAIGLDQRDLVIEQRQVFIFQKGDMICFEPQVLYKDGIVLPVLTGGTGWFEFNKDRPVVFVRDKTSETELVDFIKTLHPNFASQSCKIWSYFSLPKNMVLQTGCLSDILSLLTENGITVLGLEDIAELSDYLNTVDIRLNIQADKDWFEITLKAACGAAVVSIEALREAVLENNCQLNFKNGTRAAISPTLQKKLRQVLSFGQTAKSGLRLSGFHYTLVDQLYDQQSQQELHQFVENCKKKAAYSKGLEDCAVPDSVQATLRPYQKEGYNWLMFLRNNGWGGILADDMGLGKTLQVLTLLQKVYHNGVHTRPSLLIVPTSLLFNWQQEAEKFTPDLRVIRYHGAFRQQHASQLDSGDVILTTYKTVLNDIDILKSVEFEYVILDEAQAIKNPSSQRYKAVSILDARSKLALTGTPVENSGSDLYALMNFVNPGILGNLRSFNRLLSPKAQTEDKTHLQKVINTFILRRTKQQVAKDLPEKTEMVIYCEMEKDQREVYEAYRVRYQDALKEKINETGSGNSKLYALEGLMKLRQICNAPALVNHQTDPAAVPAKIKELMRRLKEVTPHHKVLVFSSFTGFLGLIRQQLEKSQLGYAYLDGKTKEDQRSKMVDLFQNDDHTRVFLISLKAGGTGLNLTAAEYVFLVDPWWNPAAESQAIDRCYRIGQKNNVMAYRMICKDTLEEKILNMQVQKRQLADELVSSIDGVLKSLSAEDILELFS
ncbi:DEAD/DEAH box helicase [Dyadobacter psychrotolerans]|uniref:DEAD/DEAH box helicase n=1 Tax=Dyadobacter psychrotolerans TaxID=2541721 RepID=A0A4R5D5D0_9BACT|nr:DEAD/DEAH box helicase [Dyadobacter psychrotolerans]TDE08536.1 DEAD/DEAH box helicase [Dyadobacter psychrotolerans]